MFGLCLFGVLFGIFISSPEKVQCPVEADTWIGMHRWESRTDRRKAALENHGSDRELAIRGRISFALLRFDLRAARGLTVSHAILRFHRKQDPVPLHTVGLSTISGGGHWQESRVNFFGPRPGRSWSYAGSDLTDVTFAQGGSLYAYQRVRALEDGWWEVDVPSELVHALLAEDQFGLMLCDEKGQTQTVHRLHSRESDFPPVLIVEGSKRDRVAPKEVISFKKGASSLISSPEEARRLGRSKLAIGEIILDFGSAGDDAGEGTASQYEVRYSRSPLNESNYHDAEQVERWNLDPLAPQTSRFSTSNTLRDRVSAVVGDLQPGATYHFAARASDEAGNVGPISPLGRYIAYDRVYPSLPSVAEYEPGRRGSKEDSDIQVWATSEMVKLDPRSGERLEPNASLEDRYSNSVWNSESSTVSLFGSRNEFVAFQVVIETDKHLRSVNVSVSRPLFRDAAIPEVFRECGAIQLFREWFVPDGERTDLSGGWYPDALIPLDHPLEIPAKDNQIPGQRVQPVFVDIYIPRSARIGKHRGELNVDLGGSRKRIRIELEVLPLTLPNKLNFVVDLNCYGGVNSGWDLERGTPEYRQLEVAYHRMAHLHRANLDVLGYSHDGSTTPDHAPPLEGEGVDTRVSSWADWDAHFAPILTGSAFSDLPRASVPVPILYLPFFENWPGSIRQDYKYDNPVVPASQEEYQRLVTRHAMEAEPIQDSFSKSYQDRYIAVTRQFADHIQKNGWNQTRFAVYFNNKYYWKRPSQGGRGISWWLMDEPNHRDDVLAASFLGYLTSLGLQSYSNVPIIFRTDISRVEWIRDLMVGQIDLNCISRRFFEKNRYLMNDRKRFGKEFWNYGTSNHPRESNLGMRAWCWRVFLNGGDGLLPWNAVRGASAWERAEQLTVFYPGNRFGSREPFASMRLKAYRRGQQDIEYLILLSKKPGWDRDAVTYAASRALDLSGEVEMTSTEDAGQIRFQSITNEDFEGLRRRVAQALLE